MENLINCPHCNEEINIKKALQNQVSGEVNAQYRDKYAAKDQEQEVKAAELLVRENAIKEQEQNKKSQDELIDSKVQEELKKLTPSLEQQAGSKFAPILIEAKELKKTVLAYQQKELTDQLDEATRVDQQKLRDEQIRASESKRLQAEFDSKLELQKREDEQKRKQMQSTFEKGVKQAEQGSMQIQGEAGEISIENYLLDTYIFDKVDPIKPGAKGADLLLSVSENGRTIDGTIYIEIKRHKIFKKSWIPKFTDDLLEKNADIGLLITENLPEDITGPILIDDIWVCSFENYQVVINFLRYTLIELNSVKVNNNNVLDKQSLVYRYVTSKEFARIMSGFYDLFLKEETSINYDERLILASISKRRKNLESANKLVGLLVGSFQSYCGDSLGEIKALEMDEVA